VGNYRPVRILPTPSKVIEEVIRVQLSMYVEDQKMLPASQFGFRHGHSTVMAAGAADAEWRRDQK
jgi:hypothetical protein